MDAQNVLIGMASLLTRHESSPCIGGSARGYHRGHVSLAARKPVSVPVRRKCRRSGHPLPLAPRWAPIDQTQ